MISQCQQSGHPSRGDLINGAVGIEMKLIWKETLMLKGSIYLAQ